MSDSPQNKEKNDHLSNKVDSFLSIEKNVISWFPESKFSMTCMVFFLFVGFYGVFMVSLTWLLYWFVALLFSPKIIKNIFHFFIRKKSN